MHRLLPARFALPLLALLASACGQGPPEAEPPERLWILGVEALGWERVEYLLDRGELPHFARLMERGAHGVAVATDPLDPASLWATALTGKRPAKHRVVNSMSRLPTGEVAPAPSSLRQTQALWQLLGQQDVTSSFVGFPGSWPAEITNGWLVSNMYQPQRWNLTREASFQRVEGLLETWPTGLYDEIEGLRRGRSELERSEASRFFTLNEDEYSLLYDAPFGSVYERDNPMADFAVTLQADRNNMDVALYLEDSYRPRVVGSYLELLDTLQPVYWYFVHPELFNAPRNSTRRFGNAVDEGHRWIDEQLGRILEEAGPRDAVIVVGNRGWTTGESPDPERTFGRSRIPMHDHDALLLMAGPGVVAGTDLGKVELVDLTPTVLRWLGLPLGQDMDGRPLAEAFDPAYLQAIPGSSVESHDRDWDRQARYPEGVPRPDAAPAGQG